MVSRSLGLSVTEYVSAKSYGQLVLLIMLFERPKSSLTDESPLLLGRVEDSEEVLPRYSQRELRANPCCGSWPVAWFLFGGPKTCHERQDMAASLKIG